MPPTPASPAGGPPPRPGWVAWLGRIELALGSVALLLIFASVLVQALQRYSPWGGLSFTGELARFSLVWLTFSAVGVLLTRDEHITLQLVDGVRNDRVRTGVHVFALLVVAAVGVGGFAEASNLVQTQSRLSSPAMDMPMSWLYVVPAVGFASLTVRALVGAYQVARHGAPGQTLGAAVGGEEGSVR